MLFDVICQSRRTSLGYFSSWDNSIQIVDTLLPNKTAVLPYLDGTETKPERYAKAIIWFGASEEPWLQEFQVSHACDT